MKSQLPLPLQIVIYFLGIFALLIFLYLGQEILIPIAFGIFFSLILYPMCRGLEARGIPRILAILFCLALMFLILGILFTLIISQIVRFSEDLPALTERLTGMTEGLQEKVLKILPGNPEEGIAILRDQLSGLVKNGASFLTGTISATTELVAILVLLPVYIFLFLFYRTKFKDFVFSLAPSAKHTQVGELLQKSALVIQNYVTGLMTVILIIAVLNTIGLSLLGIEYAIFFGSLAAILTVIPYIGIVIGAIPPVLLALVTKDSLWYPLGVLMVFGIVQALEGNLLTPRIVGGKVSINPLAAIISLFLGAMLWGTAGLVLFIPLIAVLKVLFDAFEPLKPFGILLEGYPDKEERQGIGKQLVQFFGKKVNAEDQDPPKPAP